MRTKAYKLKRNGQPLRFAPSLLSLRTSLRKQFFPSAADSYSLPALFNSSQPQEFSCFRATTHSRLFCHCRKACREIRYSIQNGVPMQTKYRKYYKSGSTSDIGNVDHATRWEMAHNSRLPPFFSTEVISDFPAGSSCPPRPIFTSSTE